MLRPIRSLCLLVCVSPLFLVSGVEFVGTRIASIGKSPVEVITSVGSFGNEQSIVSLGKSPISVFQRQQYRPQNPWYLFPGYPFVHYYPHGNHHVRYPMVRPYFRPACRFPGQCGHRPIIRPARPIQPPPVRRYEPAVLPPKRPMRRIEEMQKPKQYKPSKLLTSKGKRLGV